MKVLSFPPLHTGLKITPLQTKGDHLIKPKESHLQKAEKGPGVSKAQILHLDVPRNSVHKSYEQKL